MRRLHARFFGDPSLTDCISFPMDSEAQEGYRILGEVFVCPQVARRYAESHKGDPYWETTLYVVHGLLHLMGYDDISEKERSLMRAAEGRQMRHLEKRGLILMPETLNSEVACI